MIIILEGEDRAVNSLLGNTIRNSQIGSGKGALLVLHDNDGEPVHLLEKIINGQPLTPGTPVGKVPWKPDTAIIIEEGREGVLDEFEALCPGFKDRFGPIVMSKTRPARPPKWWENLW